jgi:hypothetical protein
MENDGSQGAHLGQTRNRTGVATGRLELMRQEAAYLSKNIIRLPQFNCVGPMAVYIRFGQKVGESKYVAPTVQQNDTTTLV